MVLILDTYIPIYEEFLDPQDIGDQRGSSYWIRRFVVIQSLDIYTCCMCVCIKR